MKLDTDERTLNGVYLYRMEAYQKLGQHRLAIEDINELIERMQHVANADSARAELYMKRGHSHFMLGDDDSAVADGFAPINWTPVLDANALGERERQ